MEKNITNTGNMIFKIFTGAIEPTYIEHEETPRHVLRGVASGTSLDAEGDRMSEKALRKMENQIVGLTLHKDHVFKVDNTLGHFTNAKILSDAVGDVHELVVEAELEPFDINPDAKKVYEKIKSGTRLGFSVAGLIKRWEKLEPVEGRERFLITDLELLSVDLVTVPSYRASQGSIMAFEDMSETADLDESSIYICKELGEIIRTQSIRSEPIVKPDMSEIRKSLDGIIKRIERIEANIVEPPKSRGIMISRGGREEIASDELDAFEKGKVRLI